MEIAQTCVTQKTLTCRSCEVEFFGYSETEKSEVRLYECIDCGAIYSLDRSKTMQEMVEGKRCCDCSALLEETLEEKTSAGICPMCDGLDYYGSSEPVEVEIETYRLDA